MKTGFLRDAFEDLKQANPSHTNRKEKLAERVEMLELDLVHIYDRMTAFLKPGNGHADGGKEQDDDDGAGDDDEDDGDGAGDDDEDDDDGAGDDDEDDGDDGAGDDDVHDDDGAGDYDADDDNEDDPDDDGEDDKFDICDDDVVASSSTKGSSIELQRMLQVNSDNGHYEELLTLRESLFFNKEDDAAADVTAHIELLQREAEKDEDDDANNDNVQIGQDLHDKNTGRNKTVSRQATVMSTSSDESEYENMSTTQLKKLVDGGESSPSSERMIYDILDHRQRKLKPQSPPSSDHNSSDDSDNNDNDGTGHQLDQSTEFRTPPNSPTVKTAANIPTPELKRKHDAKVMSPGTRQLFNALASKYDKAKRVLSFTTKRKQHAISIVNNSPVKQHKRTSSYSAAEEKSQDKVKADSDGQQQQKKKKKKTLSRMTKVPSTSTAAKIARMVESLLTPPNDDILNAWEWNDNTGEAILPDPNQPWKRFVPHSMKNKTFAETPAGKDFIRGMEDGKKQSFNIKTSQTNKAREVLSWIYQGDIKKIQIKREKNQLVVTKTSSPLLPYDPPGGTYPFQELRISTQGKKHSTKELLRDINLNAQRGFVGPGTFCCRHSLCKNVDLMTKSAAVQWGPEPDQVVHCNQRLTCGNADLVYMIHCQACLDLERLSSYIGETKPKDGTAHQRMLHHVLIHNNQTFRKQFSTHVAMDNHIKTVLQEPDVDEIGRDTYVHFNFVHKPTDRRYTFLHAGFVKDEARLLFERTAISTFGENTYDPVTCSGRLNP